MFSIISTTARMTVLTSKLTIAHRRCTMVLQRWYPVATRRNSDDPFDRAWRGLLTRGVPISGTIDRIVPLDVQETDDEIVVTASLPGVAPEDINVTIEDRVLSIRTESATEDESKEDHYVVRERRSGSYQRSLRLPETVDADNVESGYEHGVLTITLPKREETKAKRIEVQVS
jgi:HSP20 family protein